MKDDICSRVCVFVCDNVSPVYSSLLWSIDKNKTKHINLSVISLFASLCGAKPGIRLHTSGFQKDVADGV